jgi:hypothetical protein
MLRPNLLLDISDVADRKQQAMACYSSQLRLQGYDRQIAALNQFRTYTLPPSVRAAEAYTLIWAEELAHDPLKFHWLDRQVTEAADRVLRRDLADLQRELRAMRASSSWRVTAPLRAVSRVLRGFGRGGVRPT